MIPIPIPIFSFIMVEREKQERIERYIDDIRDYEQKIDNLENKRHIKKRRK